MKALGMIEVYSFTTALYVADLAAKSADVKIIAFDRNRPFAPGFPVPLIMVVKMEGEVAAVEAAIEASVAYAKSKDRYIVHHIIARPAETAEKMAYLLDINRDKYNKKLPKSFFGVETPERVATSEESLGILEIDGLVATIEGLDAMVKAADVHLVHSEKRLGGRLVTLVVAGTVSAVTASVEAGEVAASKLGKVYGKEVIPNPHAELLKFIDM
ncbi:MAG: BMC domain-containing protein [Clostridia bacterium]|nr:BMC domain-containing protein [Clostridia bacterium]